MTDSTHQSLDAKVIDTLCARAALAGFELAHLPDDSFVISRWGMHRELAHAAAVEQFLARATAGGTGG